MDKAVFIKKLRDIFFNLNKDEKKFSKVWLSDMDFGGLYHSGKYILNLKADHQINSYKTEAGFILDLLNEKLDKEQNSYIFSLKIYYEPEYASPDRDDIILYNDEGAYIAA